MLNPRRTIVVAVLVLFSLLAVYASINSRLAPPALLGIEIDMAKPFYVPAATDGKTTKLVIRVPIADGADPLKEVSAVKFEPRMEKGKVRIDVYALRGNAENVKSCREWDSLESTVAGSYLAAVDEEISLTKLQEYGISFGKDPLTFRVVPKRTLSPLPQGGYGGYMGGCGCASCGGLICCPNGGYCLGCGECGSACCG